MIIQVILADEGDGETAVKVAYKLKDELKTGACFLLFTSFSLSSYTYSNSSVSPLSFLY